MFSDSPETRTVQSDLAENPMDANCIFTRTNRGGMDNRCFYRNNIIVRFILNTTSDQTIIKQ